MGKIAISIVVLSVGLYVSWFVRFGDLTLREHAARILQTPEVHDLSAGIATAVSTAKHSVRAKIAERFNRAQQGGEAESESSEP